MEKFKKIVIVGVGLIGGSLALALKRADAVEEIVGAGRTIKNLEKAVQLNVIDRISENLQQEVKDAEIVVVATPVLVTDAIFKVIATADFQNTIITDVGSVKSTIVESAEKRFGSSYDLFIGGHPIAGREHSGVEAADVSLYDGKRTILTPTSNTNPIAIEKVRKMWQSAGSNVSEMNVRQHDDILATSSHLPHLIAFGLVHYIANHAKKHDCFALAASGFYDFTRIASSDPKMWSDISVANSIEISNELEGYIQELQTITQMIAKKDGASLKEIFATAKVERDHHLTRALTNQSFINL